MPRNFYNPNNGTEVNFSSHFSCDVDHFVELGVPYRRSYLLHGKPGCGYVIVDVEFVC
jgi:hypothetical protein